MVAELVEIQMSISRATQLEALQAPQPGRRLLPADRHRRARRASDPAAQGQAVASGYRAAQGRGREREAAQEDWHELRVGLAMMAAAYEVSEDEEEAGHRADEVCERLERPEVAELVEASRAEVAVAALVPALGLSGAG